MSRTNGRGESRAPWAGALAIAALVSLCACGKSAEAPPPPPAAAPPAATYQLGALSVEHPWSRPAAAGMNGVGYLTVTNTGTEDDRLLAVETGAAKTAELHQTTMAGGVMSMAPVEGGVALPAGGRAELAPGGLHVMFMGLTGPLEAGAQVPATLVFEKAGRLDVNFAVEGAGAAPAMDMGH